MSVEIYYFSGTGNTLMTARTVAALTGGKLIPIASLPEKDAVRTDADVIGIFFPVYYDRPPHIVERFAGRLAGIGGKYVFAVATYGHVGPRALKDVARLVRERGGRLAARFGIHLPQNAFYKPWENHGELFARMAKKAKIIARKVASRRTRRFLPLSTYLLGVFELPLVLVAHLLIQKSLKDNSGLPRGASLQEMKLALDKSFSPTGACDGCGLCGRVCPVRNIRLVDGRPVWLHHCENCLACYNWCPHEAILGRIAQRGYHYRHPDVTANDIMVH